MPPKIPPVTQKQWDEVNQLNKEIIEEFLQQQLHLSPATRLQYESALKIFARYLVQHERNAQITQLKARNALKYQNWLISQGLSSNAVKFKRAAVSSLCNYIELYYLDQFPEFRNIYSKAIPSPAKAPVREKVPLTKEELAKLIEALTSKGEWQLLAYLLVSYESGARREEVRQLKKEISQYRKAPGKNFYITHTVRGKGRGTAGKVYPLILGDRAMEAIQKWIEVRGQDDCPFLFVKKQGNKVSQVSPSAFNYWCKDVFSPILDGRAIFPHLIRSTRATHITVYEGKDIKAVKQLLKHESTATSEIYVVRDETEDLDDVFPV